MSFAEPRFYLDHNAGAPMRNGVLALMQEVVAMPGNATSVHAFGRRARQYIDEARDTIAHYIGAQPAGIIFTGSGSEANALVLHAISHDISHGKKTFFCSAIEHASVLEQQAQSEQEEREKQKCIVPILPSGIVDCDALDSMLDSAVSKPQLVSVMAANNETGILQPIKKIAQLCRSHAVPLHCDATQALGRIDVAMEDWEVDFMTLSAHKLGGPQGIGALVCSMRSSDDALSAREALRPLVLGGGQEAGLRAGTENVAAIAGFALALKAACEELPRLAELRQQRDNFEESVQANLAGVRIVGHKMPRLANTSCLVHPSCSAEVLLMRCDLAGVAISAGAACSSGKIAPSHVLRAMGYDDVSCRNAVRISFGIDTPQQALDLLLKLLAQGGGGK